MRIIFVYSGAENLGIEYISSFLKTKGHDVRLLFDPAVFSGDYTLLNNKYVSRMFDFDKKIVEAITHLQPDIVAFSAYTGNYRWCLNIAQSIKKLLNTCVVFGGVHTTAVPETVISEGAVDFAIIGEGEFAMFDLIEALQDGGGYERLLDTPNICFRLNDEIRINAPRPYIQDLDSMPFPDKFLFYDKVPLLEEKYLITTSRGCPYSCTYCSNDMFHKTYSNEKQHVRRRSPDNVIEELSHFQKRGRVRLVSFADDVFTFSQRWLEEFIEKYKSKINIPFFCSVHPLTITQEKALLLKEGGCCLVTMGVQSGSERIRREVFKRQGNNDKIMQSISYLKNAGVQVSVDNIFGAPTETEDDLKEGYALYKEAKPDRMLTFWLTYYPKTSIIQFAEQKGYLTKKDIDDLEHGYTGYAHDTGSISRERVALYCKYEILFHLRCLVQNDTVYNWLSKGAVKIPLKKLVTKAIIFLNALKNRDLKFMYLLKYIVSGKNTP